jgi:hypothetical protein
LDHDQDVIGAASISWSPFQAVMPQEMISPVNEALSAAGLPRIATRDVVPGIFIYKSTEVYSV